ncbi:MAG: glycosyltransferase family 39 protein, partial [Anaerolineae bacterium]
MRAQREPALLSSVTARRLLLLAILLLGVFLRFYRLDAQSFWNDEGNSARIAERPLELIVKGAAGDIHPPGYYLLLHYWRMAAGQSEFALRALSVFPGTLLVAFTYELGRRLLGKTIGLSAAFLGAVSPFAIYYSQEARMYSLLAAVSAASVLVSRGLGSTGRNKGAAPWLAYVLTCAIGLYTHYAFVFVLIAHNVVFGVRWLVGPFQSGDRWRSLARWAGAQTAVMVLYLPWLPRALSAGGWSSAGGGHKLGRALLDVLRVLGVGVTHSLADVKAGILATTCLLIVGMCPRMGGVGVRRYLSPLGWPGMVSLAPYLLVPLGLFFGFGLYKPAWFKFLVIVLSSFHLLVANGVGNVAALSRYVLRGWKQTADFAYRGSSAFLILGLTLLMSVSLNNLYFDPAYARDDYRQLAADLQLSRRPGDAIVLNAPNQWEVFTYYYPNRDVYPTPYRPAAERAEGFLAPILEDYERLFVLYWGDAESDPKKRVESWLAEHAYKAGDRWYGDVRMSTYRVAP